MSRPRRPPGAPRPSAPPLGGRDPGFPVAAGWGHWAWAGSRGDVLGARPPRSPVGLRLHQPAPLVLGPTEVKPHSTCPRRRSSTQRDARSSSPRRTAPPCGRATLVARPCRGTLGWLPAPGHYESGRCECRTHVGRHVLFKLRKIEGKEKTLKEARGKHLSHRETGDGHAGFPTKTRRESRTV